MSILINLIITFFYRNYEFNELNILKRRFNIILIPQIIGYFSIVFLTFALQVTLEIKYIFIQFILLTLIYDIIWNFPFRNTIVIKTFAAASIFLEATCILYSYLIIHPEYPDVIMLYSILIMGSVVSSLLIVYWTYRYHIIMKLNL